MVLNKWDDPEYRRAYYAKYRAANRDKNAAYARAYREANRERLIAKDREYAASHREAATTRAKAWYGDNQDRAKASRKAWRDDNPDKVAAYNAAAALRPRAPLTDAQIERRREKCRLWHKANPQANRDNMHRRRAALAGRPREKIDAYELYDFHDGICGICGYPVDRETFTVDHIIPIAKGGAHIWANVQVAHRSCNSRKRDQLQDIVFSL